MHGVPGTLPLTLAWCETKYLVPLSDDHDPMADPGASSPFEGGLIFSFYGAFSRDLWGIGLVHLPTHLPVRGRIQTHRACDILQGIDRQWLP